MSCRKLTYPSMFVLAITFHATVSAEDLGSHIQHHLDAGEFGLATRAAQRAATSDRRDQMLGTIAGAQRRAGASTASFQTLSSIGDDQARNTAFGGIRDVAPGAAGGGAQADFDSLIELITSTIAPQSWDEVGGAGAIDSFEGGVYVDSAGTMKRMNFAGAGSKLSKAYAASAHTQGKSDDVKKQSRLRKVSLNRLERQLQYRWATGQRPDATMQNLAGIQRVQYVFLYPDTGDVVIAGPAGDWYENREGRKVSVDNQKPVLQLDDLVVLLRNAYHENGRFGCSITPTKQGLADTQSFLAQSSTKPIRPSRRDDWVDQLRSTLGKQDIVVYGVDADTRVGKVLVEADYRMKLVGMGLEDGTLGVKSYLDSVSVGPDGKLPRMNVLRWWFTLNYKAIQATKGRNAYALQGQGVKVLSENERLTEQGDRRHTGKSDELNSQFSGSFTKHFEAMATKYPVYAELRNVFDLALVSALIKAEDAPGRIGWTPTHLIDENRYQPATGNTPTKVESIVNYRVIDKKHFIAGVSGGVTVDTSTLVKRDAIATDDYGSLDAERKTSAKKDLPPSAWWWD